MIKKSYNKMALGVSVGFLTGAPGEITGGVMTGDIAFGVSIGIGGGMAVDIGIGGILDHLKN